MGFWTMIAADRPQRTAEDFQDAAGLLAGGNALGDVATWTGLSASQLSFLDPSTHRPVPNPSEITARIEEVQSKWSDEERSRRRVGGRDVWMIPGAGGDLHIETEHAKASE